MVNQDGAPQDLQPGGRSSTVSAHTPRGQWESGGMERMGFDLRAGERLTSALRGTVGCLMSGADCVGLYGCCVMIIHLFIDLLYAAACVRYMCIYARFRYSRPLRRSTLPHLFIAEALVRKR